MPGGKAPDGASAAGASGLSNAARIRIARPEPCAGAAASRPAAGARRRIQPSRRSRPASGSIRRSRHRPEPSGTPSYKARAPASATRALLRSGARAGSPGSSAVGLFLRLQALLESLEVDHGALARALGDQVVFVARVGAKADAPALDLGDLALDGHHMARWRGGQVRETDMGADRLLARPVQVRLDREQAGAFDQADHEAG